MEVRVEGDKSKFISAEALMSTIKLTQVQQMTTQMKAYEETAKLFKLADKRRMIRQCATDSTKNIP